jgi:hypothetical protein
MNRSSHLAAGAFVAAGIGWLALHGGGAGLGARTGAEVAGAPASVTVVLVSSRDALAAVRGAVASDRVIAETPGGFAVSGGRIIAHGAESVGALIGAAGWTEAHIEIATPRTRDALRSPSAPSASGRETELGALLGKRTLTPGEAERALELIE